MARKRTTRKSQSEGLPREEVTTYQEGSQAESQIQTEDDAQLVHEVIDDILSTTPNPGFAIYHEGELGDVPIILLPRRTGDYEVSSPLANRFTVTVTAPTLKNAKSNKNMAILTFPDGSKARVRFG